MIPVCFLYIYIQNFFFLRKRIFACLCDNFQFSVQLLYKLKYVYLDELICMIVDENADEFVELCVSFGVYSVCSMRELSHKWYILHTLYTKHYIQYIIYKTYSSNLFSTTILTLMYIYMCVYTSFLRHILVSSIGFKSE